MDGCINGGGLISFYLLQLLYLFPSLPLVFFGFLYIKSSINTRNMMIGWGLGVESMLTGELKCLARDCERKSILKLIVEAPRVLYRKNDRSSRAA